MTVMKLTRNKEKSIRSFLKKKKKSDDLGVPNQNASTNFADFKD